MDRPLNPTLGATGPVYTTGSRLITRSACNLTDCRRPRDGHARWPPAAPVHPHVDSRGSPWDPADAIDQDRYGTTAAPRPLASLHGLVRAPGMVRSPSFLLAMTGRACAGGRRAV